MLEHVQSVVSLLKLIQRQNNGPLAMAEIGVGRGSSSADLLRRFANLTMILIDDYQQYMRFSADRQREHLKITLANTETYRDRRKFLIMDSVRAAELVPDESLHLVFIDGDHSYEAVRDDLAAWWPKLKLQWYDGDDNACRSIICGHDYSAEFPGVKQAVDEWSQLHHHHIAFLPATVWWTVRGL